MISSVIAALPIVVAIVGVSVYLMLTREPSEEAPISDIDPVDQAYYDAVWATESEMHPVFGNREN